METAMNYLPKFVTQTRKLNLSHRLVTQTENKICHTDAKIKYIKQTCRTDGKLKLSHRREN